MMTSATLLPINFRSLNWKRTDDRGDIAYVPSDRARPRTGDFGGLVGATVDIDGGAYQVRAVEAHAGAGPIREGEHIALLVSPPNFADPTAQAFEGACEALWGDHFVAPAAHLLKVDKNTVSKWRDGKSPIPSGALAELKRELEHRRPRLESALFELSNRLAAQRDTEQRRDKRFEARIGVVPTCVGGGVIGSIGGVFGSFAGWSDADRDRVQGDMDAVCEALDCPKGHVRLEANQIVIETPVTLTMPEVNALMKWLRKEVDQLRPIVIAKSAGQSTVALSTPGRGNKVVVGINPNTGQISLNRAVTQVDHLAFQTSLTAFGKKHGLERAIALSSNGTTMRAHVSPLAGNQPRAFREWLQGEADRIEREG